MPGELNRETEYCATDEDIAAEIGCTDRTVRRLSRRIDAKLLKLKHLGPIEEIARALAAILRERHAHELDEKKAVRSSAEKAQGESTPRDSVSAFSGAHVPFQSPEALSLPEEQSMDLNLNACINEAFARRAFSLEDITRLRQFARTDPARGYAELARLEAITPAHDASSQPTVFDTHKTNTELSRMMKWAQLSVAQLNEHGHHEINLVHNLQEIIDNSTEEPSAVIQQQAHAK